MTIWLRQTVAFILPSPSGREVGGEGWIVKKIGALPSPPTPLPEGEGGKSPRKGFTLLELVLAVAVSVVLMGALYLALSTQFQHARAGRAVLDEASLARNILTRMTSDITAQLGTELSSEMEADSTSSSTSSTSGTSTAGSSSTTSSTTTQGPVNLGVLGDSQRLVLTVSHLSRDLALSTDTNHAPVCDLRRITYWLVGDGELGEGLARQEITGVTGPEADSLPPEIADPASYIIAPEVKDMTLEYFDGTSWQTSWDGTSLDTNTLKPVGPPAAIAINLTLLTREVTPGVPGNMVTFRHVVALPAANR